MTRRIDLMTIKKLRPCLEKRVDECEQMITVHRVNEHSNERLFPNKGKIDMADLWYEMLDSMDAKSLKYISQFVGLFSDQEEDENSSDFLEKLGNKHVGIGMIKIRRDIEEIKDNKDMEKASVEYMQYFQKRISDCLNVEGKLFKTFDNADCVVICFGDGKESVNACIDRLNESTKENGKTIYYSQFWVQGEAKYDAAKKEIQICNYKLNHDELLKHKFEERGIAAKMAEEIKERIEELKGEKNKKMAAYYHALFQLVNVLASYEQDPLQKDFFYLFFPQFELFWKQMEKGRDLLKMDNVKTENLKKKYSLENAIEKSFGDFLDSVELLLHHMGQSYENIMQYPDELLYDIPIGLCKMYVFYMNAITMILSHDDNQYRYCLMPVAFSKPETTYFDFGLSPQDRLIKVMISRHMMFDPRTLMITLAHEASHYVGERLREERAGYLVRMLSLYLTECLFETIEETVVQHPAEGMELIAKFIKAKKTAICIFLEEEIRKKFRLKKELDGVEVYHLNYLTEKLREIVQEILYDRTERLQENINSVPDKYIVALRGQGTEWASFDEVLKIQTLIKRNREKLIAEERIEEFLMDMKYNLREIFADLSSICILQLSLKEYLESFVKVDSYIPDKDTINLKLINRIGIVYSCLSKQNGWRKYLNFQTDEENQEKEVQEYLNELYKRSVEYKNMLENKNGSNALENVQMNNEKDIFACRNIIQYEKKYCESCYKKLLELTSNIKPEETDRKKMLEIVRTLFKEFDIEQARTPMSNLFDAFENLQFLYKTEVDKMYSEKKVAKSKILQNDLLTH